MIVWALARFAEADKPGFRFESADVDRGLRDDPANGGTAHGGLLEELQIADCKFSESAICNSGLILPFAGIDLKLVAECR